MLGSFEGSFLSPQPFTRIGSWRRSKFARRIILAKLAQEDVGAIFVHQGTEVKGLVYVSETRFGPIKIATSLLSSVTYLLSRCDM